MENVKEAVEVHFGETKENIRVLSISEMEVGSPAKAAGC